MYLVQVKLQMLHYLLNFRDKYYSASRNNGSFNLNRVFINNNDTINDVLSNSGFERIKNSKPIEVQDSMASKV